MACWVLSPSRLAVVVWRLRCSPILPLLLCTIHNQPVGKKKYFEGERFLLGSVKLRFTPYVLTTFVNILKMVWVVNTSFMAPFYFFMS